MDDCECGMPPDPFLSVKDVSVRFGGIVALDGASADVGPGEVVALIGPNGAGKTTLLNVISGTQRCLTGTVVIDGVDVGRKMPVARANAGIGRTFQRADLFRELTALDHLMIGYSAGRSRVGNRRDAWRTRSELRKMARADTSSLSPYALIERLDLARYRDMAALEIPLGPARLVELGRALCSRPKVLLLDEPVSELDSSCPRALARVRRISRRHRASRRVVSFGAGHHHGGPRSERRRQDHPRKCRGRVRPGPAGHHHARRRRSDRTNGRRASPLEYWAASRHSSDLPGPQREREPPDGVPHTWLAAEGRGDRRGDDHVSDTPGARVATCEPAVRR